MSDTTRTIAVHLPIAGLLTLLDLSDEMQDGSPSNDETPLSRAFAAMRAALAAFDGSVAA